MLQARASSPLHVQAGIRGRIPALRDQSPATVEDTCPSGTVAGGTGAPQLARHAA
jgi:hypothetical protein